MTTPTDLVRYKMMVVAVVTDRNGAHDDGGEGDGDQIQDDGGDHDDAHDGGGEGDGDHACDVTTPTDLVGDLIR